MLQDDLSKADVDCFTKMNGTDCEDRHYYMFLYRFIGNGLMLYCYVWCKFQYRHFLFWCSGPGILTIPASTGSFPKRLASHFDSLFI